MTGGKPFLNYVVAANSSSATFTPFAPQTTATLTFYFAKDEGATVTCNAHVNVPAGSLPQGGIDVTVTRNCTVDAPSPFEFAVAFGTSQIINSGQFFALSQEPQQPGGIYWKCHATTPSDPNYLALGMGQWAFAQLWTPTHTIVKNGVNYHFSSNGVTGIDGAFPYSPDGGGGPFPADGKDYIYGDRPFAELQADMTAATAADQFVTYQMYLPPGTGSVWVPLYSWSWCWKGTASRPNVNAPWMAVDSGSGTITQTRYPPHPVWSGFAGQGSFIR